MFLALDRLGLCAEQRSFATSAECVTLPKDSNQALGIAEFAIDFMNGKGTPDEEVAARRCRGGGAHEATTNRPGRLLTVSLDANAC